MKNRRTIISIALLVAGIAAAGCRPELTSSQSGKGGAASIFGDSSLVEATQQSAFRLELSSSAFHTLDLPNGSKCAGDAHTYRMVNGGEFPVDPFGSGAGTVKPSFVKNVSVDVTNSNYDHISNLSSDCSYHDQFADANYCAGFDDASNLFPSFKSWTQWSSSTQHLKYYAMFDDYCHAEGVDDANPGLFVGGVDVDLDRSQLGQYENLLLHVQFFPFGPRNFKPDVGTLAECSIGGDGLNFELCFATSETAQIKVHLMSVSESDAQLQSELQPRYLAYSDEARYPKTIRDFSILSPQAGVPVERQLLIPLAANTNIDRIRIERVSGSALIMGIAIYRMGGGA